MTDNAGGPGKQRWPCVSLHCNCEHRAHAQSPESILEFMINPRWCLFRGLKQMHHAIYILLDLHSFAVT